MLSKFIKKIVRKCKAILLWERAISDTTSKNYQEALLKLTALYDMMGVNMPSEKVRYEINLLLANVCLKAGEYTLSKTSALLSFDQIENNQKISKYDREYLKFYCKKIFLYLGYHLNDTEMTKKGIEISNERNNIQKNRVAKRILLEFPIM